LADDSGKAKQNAFVVLKFLAENDKLAPFYVYFRSGLTLAESQFAIDYLFDRGLIAKTSDGFTVFFSVTPDGFKALNSNRIDTTAR
jgi:predicted transcriptional regulator